jgi:hypothetical protein
MWIPFILISALLLALYDTAKKHSVRDNGVMPVLFLATACGALTFVMALAAGGQLCAALTISRSGFWLVALKSLIVSASWVFVYYAMRALPLSKLWGAGDRTQERMRELGIRSTAELQDTSEQLLGGAFGKALGAFLHRAALGRDQGMFAQEPGSRSLSGERTFERDTADRETLESILRLLSDELAARLWAEGAESATLVLKLRFHDFSTITRRKIRRKSR